MCSFAPLKKSLYSRPPSVRSSVGSSRMRGLVPAGLLDAPVLVRAGVVREPKRALVPELVRANSLVVGDRGARLHHRRHHEREVDLVAQLAQRGRDRPAIAHHLRALALWRVVRGSGSERSLEGLAHGDLEHGGHLLVVRGRLDLGVAEQLGHVLRGRRASSIDES